MGVDVGMDGEWGLGRDEENFEFGVKRIRKWASLGPAHLPALRLSQCGPWTNSVGILWDLARNANSWAPDLWN